MSVLLDHLLQSSSQRNTRLEALHQRKAAPALEALRAFVIHEPHGPVLRGEGSGPCTAACTAIHDAHATRLPVIKVGLVQCHRPGNPSGPRQVVCVRVVLREAALAHTVLHGVLSVEGRLYHHHAGMSHFRSPTLQLRVLP